MSEEMVRENMIRMGFEPDEIDEAVCAFRGEQATDEAAQAADAAVAA